jgi:hypothetical protein
MPNQKLVPASKLKHTPIGSNTYHTDPPCRRITPLEQPSQSTISTLPPPRIAACLQASICRHASSHLPTPHRDITSSVAIAPIIEAEIFLGDFRTRTCTAYKSGVGTKGVIHKWRPFVSGFTCDDDCMAFLCSCCRVNKAFVGIRWYGER